MTLEARRPPFDPQIARALDEMRDIVVTGMAGDDIAAVRALGVPVPAELATMHGALERTEHRVPGSDGQPEVGVVAYVPVDLRRPAPVLLHLHGGGLITGTPDSDMPAVAELAVGAGCAVVSVDYRLAPEHPYPAALEDVVSVARWLARGDGPVGIDPSRIVLTGVSAGGGLAASAALYLRDHGDLVLAGLLLICPMLDARTSSPSAVQMTGVGSWDATANRTAWAAYAGATSLDGADAPYVSAAFATDLTGLPPTFVDVGSAETFRDECVDFAARMWADGGDTELHVWPGGAHAFDFLAPWAALSSAAREARAAWLRRLLARI